MRSTLFTIFALLLVGCGGSQQSGPEVASSSGTTSYAAEYPTRVDRVTQRAGDGLAGGQATTAEIPEYAGTLDEDTDWTLVLEIVNKADEAGRSHAVVEQMENHRAIRVFLEDHKKEIVRRIDRSVEEKAKESGALDDFDARGAVSGSLDEAVSQQLEDALREHNEAHQLIDDNADSLGKATVEQLQTQVDTITWTSYVVNVDLVEAEAELAARIDESDDVRKTLDEGIADRQAAIDAGELTKSQKKRYTEEVGEMTAARDSIDGSTTNAKSTHKDLDKRQQELQKAYETALDDLRKDIEARIDAQEAAATGDGT